MELTPAARTRLDLYRAYLYLILLVENGPRQYPEAEYARIRDRATTSLTGVLDRLEDLPPGPAASFPHCPAPTPVTSLGTSRSTGAGVLPVQASAPLTVVPDRIGAVFEVSRAAPRMSAPTTASAPRGRPSARRPPARLSRCTSAAPDAVSAPETRPP